MLVLSCYARAKNADTDDACPSLCTAPSFELEATDGGLDDRIRKKTSLTKQPREAASIASAIVGENTRARVKTGKRKPFYSARSKLPLGRRDGMNLASTIVSFWGTGKLSRGTCSAS